ncbi:putative MFS family arabinose efflux permease [Roseibium hamelinense]|uniref:Putative MFS family arabinose efflux permease n=1 Tax=Roseibium hamelinense TaxID=150831 RepID=A0A562TG17_9HYPH|nr:MFS transporter [Roseibium hamelinense]MTI42465.1 MFS transporter [Roseibium hamelinense]TWI92497.1 putative MFS family arabinose efflux permease [Roseibium hamelinense]
MRWRILALLFLARIGLGFQFQTVASVGDDLVVAFGLDYAGIGLLIGLFMAPGLVLAIPAGYWGRFVSDRIMVVMGLGALALGGAVSSLATESWAIGLGRIFAGAGFLFTTLYFTKMVADWFEGREIATAMSILVMSWPFGIAMGQVGHAWLAQAYGWQVPFQAASVYCLFAALGVLLYYRPPHDLPPAQGGSAVALTGQEWRLVVCAASAWGMFNAAYVTYLSFGPKVLEELGQSAIAAAGIVSIGSWLMIFSGAVCGQVVDRFGGRNAVLAVCMGGAVASLMLLGVQGGGLGASVLFGLIGMAPAGVIMAMAGQAMRPQVRAFGMGIFFTVYYAIMLVTPPIAGAILDATGNVQGPIWLAIVMFAAVIPLGLAFQYFKGLPFAGLERKVG